jgi:hypothetical protein
MARQDFSRKFSTISPKTLKVLLLPSDNYIDGR